MKKKLCLIMLVVTLLATLCGCTEAFDRSMVDMKSNWTGGLNRTITVYTANGEVIAQYTGKIDIESTDGGYVKFDHNGKRYIYYNCFVETIADI